MLASAHTLEADTFSAAARMVSSRPTQAYGHSEFTDDEHTEVVMRDGVTKRIPGRYRDYLMIAIISANIAAFGIVVFGAFSHL